MSNRLLREKIENLHHTLVKALVSDNIINSSPIPDLIIQLIKEYCEELIGEDEDDMGWTPDNQIMLYEDVISIHEKNELRQEQRAKLKEDLK